MFLQVQICSKSWLSWLPYLICHLILLSRWSYYYYLIPNLLKLSKYIFSVYLCLSCIVFSPQKVNISILPLLLIFFLNFSLSLLYWWVMQLYLKISKHECLFSFLSPIVNDSSQIQHGRQNVYIDWMHIIVMIVSVMKSLH